MRVTAVAFGTRGDIQTLLTLALGLQNAGHAVQMATQAKFCDLVQSYGLTCVPIAADVSLPSQKKAKTGRLSVYAQYRLTRQYLRDMLYGVWDAAQNTEALIFSDWARIPAIHIIEKLNIPGFMGLGHPLQMRFLYPETAVYGPPLSWLRSRLRKWALWHVGLKGEINAWRQNTLGLPKTTFWRSESEIRRRKIPLFFAHSPAVFPKPSDWPDWLHVTGYWFVNLPQTWQPPQALVDFLAAGPPPVCVGFSSMVNDKVRAMADLVLDALVQTHQRGILIAGWSDLGKSRPLPPDVFVIDRVPHDWLFPQVAAAVYHGGPGTLAAALRAGIPSVVIPFALDQPFWGWRVTELGIGPPALSPKHLHVDDLIQAIMAAVENPMIRERARTIGQQVRDENGIGQAVTLFNQYVSAA